MFRYPKEEKVEVNKNIDMKFFPVIKSNSIKDYIKAGVVTVGSKFNICGRDITCVHISGNDYIFSFDDCLVKTPMTEANETLEFIYNDDSIIPFALRKEIEYIFIPTEFQIFGKNKYGEKETNIEQFDYYKNNEAHRVKNFESGTYWYWTGSPHISNSTHFCIVNYNGNADYGSASSAYGLAPAFIIKVNNENERED